ncbi:polyol transporter 5-like [Syzygium oleosum]|uniref:polyol transporter 5-like n=1 Tax=Syzygium oleosum TaxID=219896 RepID=UPI0024B9D55F|nr:polyol transporter 5-like [Syzygium oleosum]
MGDSLTNANTRDDEGNKVFAGCIIAHVGVGYALTMTPIYVAEVSPASYCECFTSFPEVFINVGIARGYAYNYMFSMINFNGWCLMLCKGAISLVLLAISWSSPCRNPPDGSSCEESCSKRSASSPRSPPPRRKLNSNFKNIKAASGVPPEWNDELASLQSGMMMLSLCQASGRAYGIDIILLYIARFLEKAGFISSDKKILLTILVEVAKTICILVATLLLDKLRRRLLLLSSIGGMFVSLVILRTCLVKIDQIDTKHIDDPNDMKQMWVVKMCITSLFLYVASFSVRMGRFTSVFNSEPMSLDGAAFSFAVVSIIAWVVYFITMLETEDCSLEETCYFFGEQIQRRFTVSEIEMQGNNGRTRSR